MESIYGITRSALVYHQSMFVLIRDKLGAAADEQDPMWPEMSRVDGEFHRYLESQGVDGNSFINASQAWFAEFERDTTGRAAADYHADLHQLQMRRDARPTAMEYEQISRNAQLARQNGGPPADAPFGITKEALAEITSKYTELKTQFGEQQGEKEFSNYLGSRGLSPYQWASGNNAWLDRFRADPTGRAEAEFHMMLQQHSQRAHFGDVRDMSQDKVEGITLDQYAQITVAVSRQGADADAIVRQFGLQGVEHWQRANAAWGAKMGADTTLALTMQYGQLYQKYAGPQFQEEMLSQTAAMLAEANKPQDVVSEPEEELTPELLLQKMQSPSRNERWRYARIYATRTDLNNVPDKAAAIRNVTPHLIEMIEQHDEHTTSDAEQAVNQLWDLEVKNDEVRGAVQRCLNRAQEKLRSLQAAFAPIQNQAVPERVTLQSRIQDFTSLVETMQDFASRDWTPSYGGASHGAAPQFGAGVPGGFAPSGSASPGFPFAHAASSGGFPKWILAPIILIVVVGGLAFTKLRARSATDAAAKATATATAAAAAPATAATATTGAAKTAEPAVAKTASPATPKPKAAGKGKKK